MQRFTGNILYKLKCNIKPYIASYCKLLKKAFSLSELLIALAVVGILIAIVFPIISNITPDQNTIIAKRTYSVTQSVVSELLNGNCYPEKANRVGLDDGFGYQKCAKWSDNTKEGNAGAKFVTLFTDLVDLDKKSLSAISNRASFKTKDGIYWRFANLNNLNGDNKNNKDKYVTLTIDVNGENKRPNCGQSDISGISDIKCATSTKKGFDNYTMKIYQNGRIEIDDCWAVLAVRTDKKLHGDKTDLNSCSDAAVIPSEPAVSNDAVCSEENPPSSPNSECCDEESHPYSFWLGKNECDMCSIVSIENVNETCCKKWGADPLSYSPSESVKLSCCSYVDSWSCNACDYAVTLSRATSCCSQWYYNPAKWNEVKLHSEVEETCCAKGFGCSADGGSTIGPGYGYY